MAPEVRELVSILTFIAYLELRAQLARRGIAPRRDTDPGGPHADDR